jgi:hypothetical protein
MRICNPPLAKANHLPQLWRIANPPTQKFGITNPEQHDTSATIFLIYLVVGCLLFAVDLG